MKILQQTYRKSGFQYDQVWRDDHYAIYRQTIPGTEDWERYEAFRIPFQKETVNTGHFTVESGESYPGHAQWGVTAFTLYTLADAHAKIETLKEGRLECNPSNL